MLRKQYILERLRDRLTGWGGTAGKLAPNGINAKLTSRNAVPRNGGLCDVIRFCDTLDLNRPAEYYEKLVLPVALPDSVDEPSFR